MKEHAQNKEYDLDIKDRKLLLELFSQEKSFKNILGKKLKVSKEVLSYRLKRLYANGILKKIIPIFDFSALGYTIYRLQLSFTTCTEEEKVRLIEHLKKIEQIGWLVMLQGSWDIIAGFFIKRNEEFEEIYDQTLETFGTIIRDKRFSVVTSIEHLQPTYLAPKDEKTRRVIFVTGRNHQDHKLEDNAKKIIKELLENGMLTLSDLARKLDVSISTIKYHLEHLERHRIIIGYRPVIDSTKLGLEHFKVMLSLEDLTQKKVLKEMLRNIREAVYITDALGKYDLEFEAQCHQMSDVFAILDEIKKTIKIKNQELIFSNKEIIINEVV